MRFVPLVLVLLLAVFAAPARAQDVFQEGTTITVELMNGDKITGLLEKADGTKLVILHDILGRIEIARAAIKPTAPAVVVEPVSPWSGKFDFSLTGSEGNSDTQIFRTQFDLKHDDAEAVDFFTIWYRRATTDDDATEEKGFTQLRHEWKMQDSKWRPFVQANYEVDHFTSYNARAGVAGGASYQFNEGPEHKVSGRLGAGVSRKFGENDPTVDEGSYEALLGLDWYWTVSAMTNFSLTTDIYPSISDTGEYRSITKLAYETKVDPASAWFLKLGLDHIYDSQAGAGTESTDWNYYIGVGRTF